MSVLGNLGFALAGNGDLEFATRQLALAESYLGEVASWQGRGPVGLSF